MLPQRHSIRTHTATSGVGKLAGVSCYICIVWILTFRSLLESIVNVDRLDIPVFVITRGIQRALFQSVENNAATESAEWRSRHRQVAAEFLFIRQRRESLLLSV